MSIIAANASDTINLPAGATLSISGIGVAVFGPGSSKGIPVGISGTSTLGPFQFPQTFYVSAQTQLTYSYLVAGAPLLSLDKTTGLSTISAPGAAGSIPSYYGSNICIMGDSIAQQNTNIVSGSYNYLARGMVCWMLAYLGQPWEFQPSDNFAVFGTTTDIVIRDQLPVMLAAHATQRYSRCFGSFGTNDTGSGTFTLAQIKANLMTLFSGIRGAGIIPVHMGILPRGADVATTTAKQQNVAINEWLYQLSLTGMIEFVDITQTFANNATAFGNCVAAFMYDSVLHPNGLGANLGGKVMANWYAAMGIVPQMHFATQQNDVFDRVNNISGVAYTLANPLLQGGTTAPSGMATSGGTWSKVNRTLANGQVRTDCSCVLAASTTHYLSDDMLAPASSAFSATQVQPGDIMESRAKIRITSGVNIQAVTMRASTSDGTGTFSHYGLFTDTTSIPDGDHVLWVKSPRFTIPPYSGSGQATLYAQMQCITNAAASGTFVVEAFEMRKVG